jgi:hypothetical protein
LARVVQVGLDLVLLVGVGRGRDVVGRHWGLDSISEGDRVQVPGALVDGLLVGVGGWDDGCVVEDVTTVTDVGHWDLLELVHHQLLLDLLIEVLDLDGVHGKGLVLGLHHLLLDELIDELLGFKGGDLELGHEFLLDGLDLVLGNGESLDGGKDLVNDRLLVSKDLVEVELLKDGILEEISLEEGLGDWEGIVLVHHQLFLDLLDLVRGEGLELLVHHHLLLELLNIGVNGEGLVLLVHHHLFLDLLNVVHGGEDFVLVLGNDESLSGGEDVVNDGPLVSEDLVKVELLEDGILDEVFLDERIDGLVGVEGIEVDVLNGDLNQLVSDDLEVLDLSGDWVNHLADNLLINDGGGHDLGNLWLVDQKILEDLVHDDVVVDLVGVEGVEGVGSVWGLDLVDPVVDVEVLDGRDGSLGPDIVDILVPDVGWLPNSVRGGLRVEDDGVDILVEEIWVTEEGLELWVDPVLLEVGGGEVELEDRVLKVLTEEGESDVGLEEGVTDELVKAQDRDSVESLNVILVLLTPDVVKEVSEPCLLCVLPEEGVVQETGGRGLVKGLGSNAGCEEGDSDKSLHDERGKRAGIKETG